MQAYQNILRRLPKYVPRLAQQCKAFISFVQAAATCDRIHGTSIVSCWYHRADAACVKRAGGDREVPSHHQAGLHIGRHGRRHRLQPGGVPRDHCCWAPGLRHQPGLLHTMRFDCASMVHATGQHCWSAAVHAHHEPDTEALQHAGTAGAPAS